MTQSNWSPAFEQWPLCTVSYKPQNLPAGAWSPLTSGSHFNPSQHFFVTQALNSHTNGFMDIVVILKMFFSLTLQGENSPVEPSARGYRWRNKMNRKRRHCGMSMRFSVIIQVIGYLVSNNLDSLKQLDCVVSEMLCDSCEYTSVFYLRVFEDKTSSRLNTRTSPVASDTLPGWH